MKLRIGFTLVELLVVIAIIGILVALLLPAVQAAREAARRMQCSNQLKQMALSVQNFESSQGFLPHGKYGDYGTSTEVGGWSEASRSWSWLGSLLPYLEQDNLYQSGEVNAIALKDSTAISQTVAAFRCPSDTVGKQPTAINSHYMKNVTVGFTSYKSVMGANWCWGTFANARVSSPGVTMASVETCDPWANGDGAIFPMMWKSQRTWVDLRDGLSNTMLIGEQAFNTTRASCDSPCYGLGYSWAHAVESSAVAAIPPNTTSAPGGSPYPEDDYAHHNGFSSRHPGGVMFAFADGSVHFISDSVNLPVYRGLATISGGEVIGEY